MVYDYIYLLLFLSAAACLGYILSKLISIKTIDGEYIIVGWLIFIGMLFTLFIPRNRRNFGYGGKSSYGENDGGSEGEG